MSAVEFTHHDLQMGEWYLQYGYPTFIHDRVIKGQSITLNTRIPLPEGLDVVCGPNCGLLKKSTCNHKPGVQVKFTGSMAPMVSYIVTTLTVSIDRAANSYWEATTQQVTSRSINNVLNLERAESSMWSNPDLWEDKNNVIDSFSGQAIHELVRKPGASDALVSVVSANIDRSNRLFKALLAKLVSDDPSIKDAGLSQGVDRFKNRATFLAGLHGAQSQYDHYTCFNPMQSAYVNQLILKTAQRKYPEDVAKILECWKKVEAAKEYEAKPFDYDIEHCKTLLKSKKFTKPTKKADEVVLPF
jgi:hypothetical protein